MQRKREKQEVQKTPCYTLSRLKGIETQAIHLWGLETSGRLAIHFPV